mmetsp:Transcript_5567/g.9639  ORF Transcript_5567/g.9639 Transcript_5567/m.9639 type:complete len:92 (-) Transcript_5567:2294-2569(-)
MTSSDIGGCVKCNSEAVECEFMCTKNKDSDLRKYPGGQRQRLFQMIAQNFQEFFQKEVGANQEKNHAESSLKTNAVQLRTSGTGQDFEGRV